MRALAMIVLAVALLVAAAPASASSSITGPRVVLVQAQTPLAADCDCERRPISSVDLAARLVYAALGAGAGYLYATMPVATTAVAAAFAGGVITMWVYSSYYFKPVEAELS